MYVVRSAEAGYTRFRATKCVGIPAVSISYVGFQMLSPYVYDVYDSRIPGPRMAFSSWMALRSQNSTLNPKTSIHIAWAAVSDPSVQGMASGPIRLSHLKRLLVAAAK